LKSISSAIVLFTVTIFINSCTSVRLTNAGFSGASKRTVTFNTHNANQLSDAEEAIANMFLSNEMNYIPKYVEINYDNVNKRLDSLYSSLNYWNKVKYSLSRKRPYRMYADAAGTDHLLDLEIHIIYDKIQAAGERPILWDFLWKNIDDIIKELEAEEAHYMYETYNINHIKYKLRYIDGYSGKTFWKMRCRWPSAFFGSRKHNPILKILKKFDRRFPYKLVNS
jgi:hypothetical protein